MSQQSNEKRLATDVFNSIHYKDFVDLLPLGILLIDVDAKILYANERAYGLTDKESRHLVGRDWRSLIHPDDAPSILEQWLESVRRWQSFANTYRIYTMKGASIRVRMEATLEYIPSIQRTIYLCYFQQIGLSPESEPIEALGEIKYSDNIYETIVANVPIGLYGNNAEGKCVYVNQRTCELLDISLQECLDFGWNSRLHPEDSERVCASWAQAFLAKSSWQDEFRFLHSEGSIVWVLARCVFTFDEQGTNIGSIGSFTDITAQKKLEENLGQINQKLQNLANLDGLTGISNRRYFDEFLAKEWFRLETNQSPLSILMIDIDYFKAYNDTYGHVFGDKVLKTVAEAIDKIVQIAKGVTSRYGGEEFSVVLSDIDSDQAVKVASMILAEIYRLKIHHQGSKTSDYLTLSIGVSTNIPSINQNPEISIREADIALYLAKQNGRNRIVVYSDDIAEVS